MKKPALIAGFFILDIGPDIKITRSYIPPKIVFKSNSNTSLRDIFCYQYS